MAIDITKECPIPFDLAATFLGNGFRPTYSTWWRWWRHGIRGVHLETVLVGGRRLTTADAVERFVTATSAAGSVEALSAQSGMKLAMPQDHFSTQSSPAWWTIMTWCGAAEAFVRRSRRQRSFTELKSMKPVVRSSAGSTS